MESQPPSYPQATSTQDWLDLVAAYVDVHDYRSLCLVNKRFYAMFAPCLFRSPLEMGGQLTVAGDPDRERVWYRKLMRTCLEARPSTMPMIRVLDFRTMSAVDSSSAWTSPVSDITAHVNDILRLLPNLHCLVLDGRADYNLRSLKTHLGSIQESTQQPLKKVALLSLRDHPQLGSSDIFHQQALSSLVYLDVSSTSAHDLHRAQSLVQRNLPNLRVLKLSHMALDSATVGQILHKFLFQFWSLDVSHNKLDDRLIRSLRHYGVRCNCNSMSRLQNDVHFDIEGRLRRSAIAENVYLVEESDSSATFSHPLRYLADPPVYNKDHEDGSPHRHSKLTRLVGTERIRGDTVDDAITVLAGSIHESVPVTAEWPSRFPSPGGLTHLHMNGLEVSLKSIQSLLVESSGYIEHFECDQARFSLAPQGGRGEWVLSKASWLSTGTVLSGFHGSAFLFRPVISSNLRVLKIHHSLVTNVPTVLCKSTSALENIWVAEKLFHGPIDLAYPQTYVPDMNPRLYSLTLAHIPRYSPGIVAARIINFLKLLAAQEQAIEQIKKHVPHRGPPVLRGLRHIRLEFDPDAHTEMANLNTDDDVDEALDEFSSFTLTDSTWDAAVTPPEPKHHLRNQSNGSNPSSSSSANTVSAPPSIQPPPPQQIPNTTTTNNGRLNVFPYTATQTEHYPCLINPKLVVDVWIGNGKPGAPSNTPAVNAYMRALTHMSYGHLNASSSNGGMITPATPCHVVAGVPAGSYLFDDAWDRLASSPLPAAAKEAATTIIKRPTKAELADGMRDVLEEIKAFRLASREVYARLVEKKGAAVSGEVGQHEYWKGRVEISMVKPKNDGSHVMYGQ